MQLHNFASQPLRDDGDVEGVFLKTFGSLGFDVLEPIQAALAFGRSCRRSGPNPLQFSLHVAMCTLLNGLGIGAALGTLFQEVAEVAMVAVQGLVFQFQDAVADIFQEIAVVRHHEEGGSHGGQTLLQPRDHVQVEVVGRLVEDQKIGSFEQDLCERDTSLFAAAQQRHLAFQVVKVEFAKNLSGPCFEVPAFVRVHRVVGLLQSVTFPSFGHGALVVAHRQHRRAVADVQGVHDGGLGLELQFLPQMSMPYPR